MRNFSKDNDINIRLNKIFKNKFNIDLYKNNFDIDANLLQRDFKLRARDLIYLLYYIEKEFNISISRDDIYNTEFNTIRNITYIINKEINKKGKQTI